MCYQLLAFCARDRCDAAYYEQLTELLEGFTQWEDLPALAAPHGLGPLLYKHLRAVDAPMPRAVRRELQGFYLQARRASQARDQLLGEILWRFEEVGVTPLVLKGATLAHLIYTEPALRPMSDVDLLVRPTEWTEAEEALRRVGFHVSQRAMPVVEREGVFIGVELHHDLSNEYPRLSKGRDELTRPLLSFQIGADGPTACTLGYEEMLWHLCYHMRFHATVFTPHRLIWVADIVTFAERFQAEIDWGAVEREFPSVHRTLSLLPFMTAMSESLMKRAGLERGQMPKGIGQEFEGWPRSSIGNQRSKGWPRILHDTFFPSEWWLRLHYNLDSSDPLLWQRWVGHPLHIFGWVRHLLRERRKQQAQR